MTDRQRTVARPFEAAGCGLHTGAPAEATARPAPSGTGIVFRRVDLPGAPEVTAAIEAVASSRRETALRRGRAEARSVEHLLAAAWGLGIDNLRIDLAGPEPPALDGSAAPWCRLLTEAGQVEQEAPRRRVRVREAFALREGGSRYEVAPGSGLRVSATIEFDHPLVGRQEAEFDGGRDAFVREIAPARTFGFAAWRDELRARGLAHGAGVGNALILTEEGLAEGQRLRFANEFARHKALDLVGDLALLGARLDCRVRATRPSHRGNLALARSLARLGAEGLGGP